MKSFLRKFLTECSLVISIILLSNLGLANDKNIIHVWEMIEIKLTAEKDYNNYYMDVTCWVELKGPDFSKRIYGFWNGGNDFIVRIVASKPGKWEWESNSNHPEDEGLNYKSGSLMAIEWTEKEKQENPNRRGFLRSTSNGHALQYADGT